MLESLERDGFVVREGTIIGDGWRVDALSIDVDRVMRAGVDISRLPYDGDADRWFDPAWLTVAGGAGSARASA